MFIVLSGRNGAGKTTVARRLIEEHGFRPFTGPTTRAPRESDLPGEYEYISPEEFAQRQEKGLFAWYVHYAGASYGTDRECLKNAFRRKRERWVDILVPNATDMHEAYAKEAGVQTYGREQGVFYFYLEVVDSHLLYKRLRDRGESHEDAHLKLRASTHFGEEVRKINARIARFSIIDSEHQNVEQAVQEILSVVTHWGS